MSAPVVVWVGHAGKPTADPGACGPAGCEADIVGQLAPAIAAALRSAGVAVADLGAGTYADRAEFADDIGARLVLHVHLDVGTPAAYHFGTELGRAAATRLVAALAPLLKLQLREATAVGYPRARGLLMLTRAPAVLLELADVRDAAAVDLLRTQATEIGQAIARAVG